MREVPLYAAAEFLTKASALDATPFVFFESILWETCCSKKAVGECVTNVSCQRVFRV